MKTIKDYLIPKIYDALVQRCRISELWEIRMRVDRPLVVYGRNGEVVCYDCITNRRDITDIFQRMTEYSAYAYEYSIKKGYLTLEGGHRAGFGGEVVYENGQIRTIKNIRFINLRVSHACVGCGEQVAPNLLKIQNEEVAGIYNTLIVSPPGWGKTTLLRDLIRIYSMRLTGTSICVVDEREEIGGSFQGTPTIDLGMRTDVISGCEKAAGILMAIRSMAPQVIAVDEIGEEADAKALQFAAKSGVAILATMHGETLADVQAKLGQAYGDLFQKYIVIPKKGEYRCY